MVFNFSSEADKAELKDICRCLENLLNIPSNSIPLARGMGISWSNLSQIPPNLENDIATEIIEKVEEYEPRIAVSEVTFTYDSAGMAAINIVLEEGEDSDRQ